MRWFILEGEVVLESGEPALRFKLSNFVHKAWEMSNIGRLKGMGLRLP